MRFYVICDLSGASFDWLVFVDILLLFYVDFCEGESRHVERAEEFSVWNVGK